MLAVSTSWRLWDLGSMCLHPRSPLLPEAGVRPYATKKEKSNLPFLGKVGRKWVGRSG